MLAEETMKKYYLLYLIPLLITTLFAETITVSGRVIDTNTQEPITNVNIFTETNGIITDKDGNFSFLVEKSELLTFSYIGFKEITFSATDVPQTIELNKYIIKFNQIIVKGGLNTQKLSESKNSITVITNGELHLGKDEHFQDILPQIPNITYASATSRPRYLLIRGIGEISQFAGEGPPNYSVGYIIDDIDFSGIGSIGSSFDIDQVEIYKGPQTFLFGPNAMAGVINLHSLNPTPFLSGKALMGINSDNGKTTGITISNAIGNTIAMRLTAFKNYTDGFIYNAYKKKHDSNKIEEQYLRSKLIWEPSRQFKIKLTILKGIFNNGYDAWSPDNNSDTTFSDYQGKDKLSTEAYSIRTTYKLSESDISSILTYSENEINYNFDGDWGNDDYWQSDPYNWDEETMGYAWAFIDETYRNRKTLAHDLRFSKSLNNILITSGIYLKGLTESDKRNGWLFGGQATDISTEFNINIKSFYLNTILNSPDKTELSFGARFNQTNILYDGTGNTLDYTTWEIVPILSLDTSITTNMIGYHSSIKHRLNNVLHLFTSFSRGYKAGGINQNPYLIENQRIYNPEYNLNLSTGLGYQGDGLEAMVTAFYMKRTNQQVRLSFQVNPEDPLSFDFFTANVTEGFNSGFEASVKMKLQPNLSIMTNIGLLRNYVESHKNPLDPTQTFGDRAPAHSPAFNYSFIINYFMKNGLSLNLENSGVDEFYFEDQYNPKSEFYSLFNVNLGYTIKNWDISIWGKNILNEKYPTRGYYFDLGIGNKGAQSYKMFGKPAHFGISTEYHF